MPESYQTDCVRCGAAILTPATDVTCAACGLAIRIEWLWDGRVEQG